MKKTLLSLALVLSLSGCATHYDQARLGAVGDSVSTAVALSSGAVEANPLLGSSPSPGALLAVMGAKLVLIEYAKDNPTSLKALSSIFNGITVSNLLVAAGAATGAGLVVGAITGIVLWNREIPAVPVE